MWVVRPAQRKDVPDLIRMAGEAGVSSTLGTEESVLLERVAVSEASFAQAPTTGGDAGGRFLFVLEDTTTGELAGSAGIDARAGNGQPFYNYRQDALIHASHELCISRRVEVLYPSHGLTDRTLLCGFLIRRDLRGSEAFELLSRSRLMFIAAHRPSFAGQMVVELPGLQEADGVVPFWDSLGRHFFNMDFATADRYSGTLSKTFIAELMPPNPIYVTLLTEAAQAAMGCAHEGVAATASLLQREGFRTGRYLDIFDGGPVMEAATDSLQTLASAQRRIASLQDDEPWRAAAGDNRFLLAYGSNGEFRCVTAATAGNGANGIDEETQALLALAPKTAEALGCPEGGELQVAPL